MCGIAGVLYRDPQRPVQAGVLAAMAAAVAHRGPDAEGFFRAPGVGLAHRRLSIIDLAGGDQPIGSEDGSLQVVLNGEIYNYRELRAELVQKGHQFRTESDTEVLVHLYEEAGDELVHRLRGMFAFALWDGSRRRLLFARDRVGLKPLYVYRDAEKLLFGSELKAILAHPAVDRSIDPAAVEDFLTWGMIPGKRSIFSRAEKLSSGHVLAVTADSLDALPRRYWELHIHTDRARSLDQWQEAVRAKVEETVEAHRVADVPVGAFLSGGLDSSVMVAVQSRLASEPVETFSVGFREAAFDELRYARKVAERFGTQHTEEIVTPEAAAGLDDLVWFYDEPFADSSALPTMYVARLARRRVKVVISGDGGDEAFGGYARYAHDLREAALRRRLPGWLRRGLLGPLARLWPKADWLPRPLRLKTAMTNLSLGAADAYANTLAVCRRPLRHWLLNPDLAAALAGYRPEEAVIAPFGTAPRGDALAGMIAADVGTLLPDDFLVKVDRASMSVGLEVRPPLVDHELLEFAAAIPSELKVRGGCTKWLFKKAFEHQLPEGLSWRTKQGFDVPVDAWLRGPLREVFEESVLRSGARIEPLVERSTAARLYRDHRRGIGRHGPVLWSLLVLARWAEAFLGGEGVGSRFSNHHAPSR